MLSPCKKTCLLEEKLCVSCGRTVSEIVQWKHIEEGEKQRLMSDVFPLRLKLKAIHLKDRNLEGFRLSQKDQALILEHFLNLDPNDRRSRFGYAMEEESLKKWIENLDWGNFLVWAIPSQTQESHTGEGMLLDAVGMLSPDGHTSPILWEVGLSVLSHARQRGLGHKLLRAALEVAKGITPSSKMMLYTQNDCIPIFKLVRAHGGKIQTKAGETIGLFSW